MSQPRTEINRAKRQHSTGPKTEEGKQRSSVGSLRQGLTSQMVVPDGDPKIYDEHNRKAKPNPSSSNSPTALGPSSANSRKHALNPKNDFVSHTR